LTSTSTAAVSLCYHRILDVLLTNKCEAALLKVAVTLMSRAEAKLVEMGQDLEKILTYLKVEIPGGCERGVLNETQHKQCERENRREGLR
jgi:hypothetical protein